MIGMEQRQKPMKKANEKYESAKKEKEKWLEKCTHLKTFDNIFFLPIIPKP